MANKALYILAGFDDETEKYLAGIQQKLYEKGFVGTQTKDIPMHTTLGSFPVEKEEELKAELLKLSEECKAFDITFNHVGLFGGEKTNVLFIAPDINRDLLDLKEKFGDSFGWMAHATMLIDAPDVIGKAIPEVLNNFKAFHGKVSYLHLFEFFPTRHILTVKFEK